jgi:hypothetical protein
MFFRARENSGHTFDRISDASAQNAGSSQRIETAFGLACDQARDQRLSCSWRDRDILLLLVKILKTLAGCRLRLAAAEQYCGPSFPLWHR